MKRASAVAIVSLLVFSSLLGKKLLLDQPKSKLCFEQTESNFFNYFENKVVQ